jgi:cyclic pyranopterin phosphate synthase
MVDVGQKPSSSRTALAQARVFMRPQTYERIANQSIAKGDVFETARIAGIMAAKKTPDLIPLCHPLQMQHVGIEMIQEPEKHAILIRATARVHAQTGVEMEALAAASVAALTIYDMCKAVDKDMVISDICLLEKAGGKSGTYHRPPDAPGSGGKRG